MDFPDTVVAHRLRCAYSLMEDRFPAFSSKERISSVYSRGEFAGWVFCTGTYPATEFVYVTLTGVISPKTYPLRQLARRALQDL